MCTKVNDADQIGCPIIMIGKKTIRKKGDIVGGLNAPPTHPSRVFLLKTTTECFLRGDFSDIQLDKKGWACGTCTSECTFCPVHQVEACNTVPASFLTSWPSLLDLQAMPLKEELTVTVVNSEITLG